MNSPISNKETHYYLEAKSSLSSNRFNNVLLFFGDILKNRKHKNEEIDNGVYGAFLEYDKDEGLNSYFVKRICESFTNDDWNKFGNMYNCELIFFYDAKVHKLYYSRWHDFIDNKELVEFG